MAAVQESDQPDSTTTIQDNPDEYRGLDPESYTAQRLRHASAHHLHLTSRRFFIGPIPDGWIQSHRKSWYRARFSFKDYTSRTITFTTKTTTFDGIQQRQNTTEEASPTREILHETENEESPSSRINDANETESHANDDVPAEAMSSEDQDDDVTIRDHRRAESAADTQVTGSFETARETLSEAVAIRRFSSRHYAISPSESHERDVAVPAVESARQREASQVLSPSISPIDAGSTTSLLNHQKPRTPRRASSRPSTKTLRHQEPEPHAGLEESANPASVVPDRVTSRLARFNIDDNMLDQQERIRSRIERTQNKVTAKIPRWNKDKEGEMIRAQKMLVRVEETVNELPIDYSENESLRMETREVAKWREYLVVCREGSDEATPYILKMYKTRVVQDVEKSKKSAYYEIPLNNKQTKVNLYSSLDKTLVIWHPHKRGTRIFIIRPRSAAHAVEWYTFVRQSLGWHRSSSLLINVPDLSISLLFKNPFEQTQLGCGESQGGEQQRNAREQLAAAAIVSNCMNMLKSQTQWSQVLAEWSKSSKMGLVWKRYDRLEWVHGANERQMYGTIAMQTTHDLELRPKHHYLTTVTSEEGHKEEEPAPVEGFLIRLTTQKGVQQRMGKAFSKRQYFYTQDRFLCFCKPAKSLPPQPPRTRGEDFDIPSFEEIVDSMPLQYDVDPFPEQDGQVTWLNSGNKEFIRRHDEEAFAHSRRTIHNLSNADGIIDMCQIQQVRHTGGPSRSQDPNGSGGQGNEDSDQDEINRTFELTMDNGLVIRLQAYNATTQDEWVKRLEALTRYWKARVIADSSELKVVRQHNLDLLNIDEEMESIMGQFASKWEVKRAQASPHLYNMCPISGCRPIKMSGQLYRKPRRRSTFHRCHIILTEGQLLIFQDSLRKRTGVEIPHIHKELVATLDLQDCYIYSGFLTESDQLYANQTFDSNHPGHHALPRIYLSQDGWTSQDEDSAICFAIWHPTQKSFFRALQVKEDGKTNKMLRRVSALGVPGRSVVFKARSRVERDRWVLSIESEIDRLQEERGEDIRIV